MGVDVLAGSNIYVLQQVVKPLPCLTCFFWPPPSPVFCTPLLLTGPCCPPRCAADIANFAVCW